MHGHHSVDVTPVFSLKVLTMFHTEPVSVGFKLTASQSFYMKERASHPKRKCLLRYLCKTASKWYMFKQVFFLFFYGTRTVLSGFKSLLSYSQTSAIFLCDYHGLQTRPIYGFSQNVDIAGLAQSWCWCWERGIGRDLTIRFSRQSKYLSRSPTILNAQLLASSFFEGRQRRKAL